MFINKVVSVPITSFKGYQHKINNVGESVMRFNFVYDYEKEDCEIQFFKLIPTENYEYKIVEEPIKTGQLKEGGVDINLQDITNLDKNEPFAYRFVIKNKETGAVRETADTGMLMSVKDGKSKLVDDKWADPNGENKYTFVSRTGTAPKIQGAGYLTFPDSQRVGVKYRDFDSPNTGEIYIDKNEQKDMEKVVRSFSNKAGGNLAGLEYNLDYLAQNGYKVQPANPVAGGDNKSSHHYWNKNNFQISDDMGNIENYNSYIRKLFQKGISYVYDGTFTSEGLEGIHFQYALRWADKNPQTYYWFKMQSLKDQALGLGVVPNNKESLRHRVINPPVIYNESTKKIEKNPNYNPDKETYFQIYDGTQVSDSQLSKLDKPIENYEKIKSDNLLAINSHDDTLINFVFEVNPKEYKDRLNAFADFSKSSEKNLTLNSPDGTILMAQFSNFKIDRKTEGGFVTWDANTDMVKMNYQVSGYDEKIAQANAVASRKDFDIMMRVRGAYEVQDMALQAGRYMTKHSKDTQIIYVAQTLKGAKSEDKYKELISNGLLPKESLLSQEKINNVLNGYYDLDPKGVLSKDDTTIKALMELPFDTLEFAENTVGVLSTSYFSNRAISKDTLGLNRFDLMKKNNPHLVKEYSHTYLKANQMFTKDIKNFADEVIKKVDSNATEKLLDKDGNYTEYGEYVIELMGKNIAKYAFLKSLTGDSLKTKTLPNGEITYDYKDIKDKTSLKSLGIHASNPTEEAEILEKLIYKGLGKLSSSDVDYVANAISKRINGTNLNSFRLAEATVKEAGLGLSWRLDAAKDMMDQDAIRNGDTSFDETWDKLIHFWKRFVNTVKTENPNSYIVAEMTDIEKVMKENLGEYTGCYGMLPDIGLKFKSVPDAMTKFFNETGITSEAAYSYFYTDLLKVFGPEYECGEVDMSASRHQKIVEKINELIRTKGIDYARTLFTFVGNHDKPRILQGLALDMGLFHGDLGVYDGTKANFGKNHENRKKVMIQLANADDFASLPLEAKLNIDNPEYFNTVSTYAAAMSQLLRKSINDSLNGKISNEEMSYLKSALVDLVNGNYLGSGKNTQIPSINIPELSSAESALKEMLKLSNITVTDEEFSKILEEANKEELVNKYLVQGDFDWSEDNEEVGKRNQEIIEKILRGAYENSSSNESDFKKYSTYTAGVAGLLREAFINVKGDNANARYQFLNGAKAFVKKYDRATVEASRIQLPYYESTHDAMAKNNFGAQDIKTAVEMLANQAEYKARKDGKLGENAHFADSNKIVLETWKNATEPAVQKATMMMTFLSALMGLPTIYGGDELGLSGYDEKAKNVYLKNRNPLPWSELEEGIFKEYRERVQKAMNGAMSIRSREGVDALNNGAAYSMSTSNRNIPAMLMQDGYGNMTVSVFNSLGIDPRSGINYFDKLGITKENKEKFFADNHVESINPDNPYVPIQKQEEIDYIALGAGLSLPIGLTFMNSDSRDKSVYEIVKDYKVKNDKGEVVKNIPYALVRKGGNIVLNSLTAKNGAMVLKHVSKVGKQLAFRGSSQLFNNKQYRIISNPYQIEEEPIEGEKLSLTSR